MQPLTIGNLKLATNLLLAPIAGYCDVAFRLVARSCGGVGLACTDLLSPEGILRATVNTVRLLTTTEADAPLCMQLYGANVERMCELARWAQDNGAHAIDINMGCPVDKVTKTDGGSKLLCDPDRTVRMVERLRAVVTQVPLTAKMRLGWDDTCIVAPTLARRLEDAGIELVTIHGRTTAMKFSGHARLDGIAEVVAAVRKIPVIGNGDVRTPADVKHMIDYTKCRGVMIARGALSMPWIFRDSWSLLTTGVVPPPPAIAEKCQLMREHFHNMVRFVNERATVCEFRKRVSWYAKQMHPCRSLKEGMRAINSTEDFERVLTGFLEWRLGYDEDVARGRIHPTAEAEPAEAA